jgi:hypothetical protein
MISSSKLPQNTPSQAIHFIFLNSILNMLFIKMRQFHNLIFESMLDFCLETSYSFLIFVFSTLRKSSTY